MATEESTRQTENVPAELLHKLFSFWFVSHGGSHVFPLNPFLRTALNTVC